MKQRPKVKYVLKQPPDKSEEQSKDEKPKGPQYIAKNSETTRADKPRNEYHAPQQLSRNSSSGTEDLCVICSEGIKKRDAIWTCQCCCLSMHLTCIKQWIHNVNRDKPKEQVLYAWTCPQCNFKYADYLPKYYCYCGKYSNPELERDLPPHSCGQICDRKRGLYCPHLCPERCHRGKCPPCTHEGVLITCNCGKTSRVAKCSEERGVFQCGKKCEKVLNCGKHKCQRNCHHAECHTCKKKHLVQCHCGKNEDVVDCLDQVYACKEPCGKTLNCQLHKCLNRCHQGPCEPCMRDPTLQKTCPCGQYSIEMLTGDQEYRKICSDAIPSCGMPCTKKLNCGHKCPRTCHDSPCNECKMIVDQPCNCAQQTRKIECFKRNKQVFKCENICRKKKTCGIHSCNTECCPIRATLFASNHPCQLTCNKISNCGKHECGQPCHLGLCKKCPVIYSQAQPCPCGKTSLRPPILCGTVVPECENACKKDLPCGHTCALDCHYGACKCFEDVKVSCRCGGEIIATRCGREALCMNKCQKDLECGHKCLLQCHVGECLQAHKNIPCRKICGKKRQDCSHICSQICHFGKPCSNFPCEAQILIRCECGHRQTCFLCGSLNGNSKIVCNKKCENFKRFSELYRGKQVYYPNNMVQFAARNLGYLTNLEAELENFILHSQKPLIELEFKFTDDKTKNILLNLFENNYHLNAHFYKHRQYNSFTIMQTESTLIPKPSLTAYFKLISTGKIKPNALPFELTISFQATKDKAEVVMNTIKHRLHSYYLQRKDKMAHVHFWQFSVGEEALGELIRDHQSIEFRAIENDTKCEEDQIKPSEIVDKTETFPIQVGQAQKSQIQQIKGTTNEEAPHLQISNQQAQEKVIMKSVVLPEKKNTAGSHLSKKAWEQINKPGLIIRSKPLNFRLNNYPDSSQFVQLIYRIDEDELFLTELDYPKITQQLCCKTKGPQATEWVIRTLLLLSSSPDIKGVVHQFPEQAWSSQFTSLLIMYSKDKAHTRRILQIQRLNSDTVKKEMASNHVYLSDHEPEIMGYLRLWNYFAVEKIPFEEDEIINNSFEYSRTQLLIELLQAGDAKKFYEMWEQADCMLACAMIPFVHHLRESVLEALLRKEKVNALQGQLGKYLLFEEQTEFRDYCLINGVNLIVKKSKEQYYLGEITGKEIFKKNHGFLKKIREKRDKKFFLSQAEDYVEERLMTRSFFAFGDFKESIDGQYMIELVRSLKGYGKE